jgi:cell division protein ZapA
MKKLILGLLVAGALQLNAQRIKVYESIEKFSLGSQNALVTTIYEAQPEDIMREWKKLMKDYKHEKVKESGEEVFADNILIKDWGNNPVDIYAVFNHNKKDKTTQMSAAVDLGGAYLKSSDKDKYNYMERKVREFAITMSKAPIEENIRLLEKNLAKQEENIRDAEKDIKSRKSDIENYKSKIAKAEKDIIDKNSTIDKKEGEILVQKKVVDASSDAVSEQSKSSKKIYEKLVDQKNDMEKDKKNLEEDIEDYREKIKKAEKQITENEEAIKVANKEIEAIKKSIETDHARLSKIN